MEKILSPKLEDDLIAQEFIGFIENNCEDLRLDEAMIFYDYPLYKDIDDTLYRTPILLLSRNHSILIVQPVTATFTRGVSDEILHIDSILDQLSSIILSKLIKSKILRRAKIGPVVGVVPILFITNVEERQLSEINLINNVIQNYSDFKPFILETEIERLTDIEWQELKAIIEGSKAVIRPKDRSPKEKALTLGAIISALESEIANFDSAQRKAAISIARGPQRIRGLAGSGKTIVLAMKAAHLHLSNPDSKILFTFHTRSLYDFIKLLITRYYRQYNDYDPDWEMLNIHHSWGGRNLSGVYFNACIQNGVHPIPLNKARHKGKAPFDFVCSELLKENISPKYDYILMDEAQDLPVTFYKLCYRLIYPINGTELDKNIIWAYDDLQSIMEVDVLSPKEAFGANEEGVDYVELERAEGNLSFGVTNDIILHKCYRNPREILICAHALGFGIYSENIVQMLENVDHWQDLGYIVEKGTCKAGEETEILRPPENSPLSISDKQTIDELIHSFHSATFEEEVQWICNEVLQFLEKGLRPDDIMIISLDDRNARLYFNEIQECLNETDVGVNNLLDKPFGYAHFYLENKVTLTTVYRAKGNESPVVLACGVDAIFTDRNSRTGRNKIFTALTRAKAWLRVSGVGKAAEFFVNEILCAKENFPYLKFIYPSREQIITLQRDFSDKTAKMLRLVEEMDKTFEKLDMSKDEIDLLLDSLRHKK